MLDLVLLYLGLVVFGGWLGYGLTQELHWYQILCALGCATHPIYLLVSQCIIVVPPE
jgi:hypothetical protein